MRFLANENLPLDAVALLRLRGHDVVWIRTEAPGSSDALVLTRAAQEQRILLTFDEDFGELAFRSGAAAPTGIILFRLRLSSPGAAARRIADVLEQRSDWSGNFSVVEDDRIRMVALPKP